MTDMSSLMSSLRNAWAHCIAEEAGPPLPLRRPRCGVHVRRWGPSVGISVECDPGYAGIGATLTALEARHLGLALIAAADVCERAEVSS